LGEGKFAVVEILMIPGLISLTEQYDPRSTFVSFRKVRDQ
jgi:hypothetical protein